MPKGPKQQPPEPEWIGDGETTSPTGKAGRQRRKKIEKRRERNVRRVPGEGGGRETHRAVRGATAHACSGAGKSLPWQECFWDAGEKKRCRGVGLSGTSFSNTGQETEKSVWGTSLGDPLVKN